MIRQLLHLALFRVPVTPALHCHRCRWTKTTVGRQQAALMGRGYSVGCPWCGHPMTRKAAAL